MSTPEERHLQHQQDQRDAGMPPGLHGVLGADGRVRYPIGPLEPYDLDDARDLTIDDHLLDGDPA